MSEFWSFILSPMGLALYAAFWAFKLLFGAFVVSQLMRFLPEHSRDGLRHRYRHLASWWTAHRPFAPALVPAREQRRAKHQNLPPVLNRQRQQ